MMPDAIFHDPRLAALYDALDPDRSDLDHYEAIVEELGARSVLDIGCGTGSFACLLAARGIEVIGVDPAAASIDVARAKPGAAAVQWMIGDAPSLPEHIVADDTWIMSTSTLRFRSRDEVEQSLDAAGFGVVDVRDAPDRPGREFVFIARRR